MNIFEVLFIVPIVNLLVFFYNIFTKIGLPGAMGWSIVGVTSAVRLAINPFMKHQMEQSQKMQRLQPQIAKLQKKYKTEPVKLQQAQMEIYKNEKINPGYGCLIFIIQIPIFIGLYNALTKLVTNGTATKAIEAINSMVYTSAMKITHLDMHFLGLDLTRKPSEWQTLGWWYALIPIVTALSQMYQAYLTTKMNPVAKKKIEPVKDKKNVQKTEEPDMQAMMQKQMMYIFPLMIGWVSFNFPVGLALYWNIFTLFGIWQYSQKPKISPEIEKKK